MEDLQGKIKRLEAEIAYLRRLLDANSIQYKTDFEDEEELLPAPEADQGKRVIQREPTIAMVRFFYSYFRGRKDVYSKRAKLKNGGFGYFPVCDNFWRHGICPKADRQRIRCQDCANQKYRELSVSVLMDHLKGSKTDCSDVIGLYPMRPDNTCYFLVFDFDNHAGDQVSDIDEGANTGTDWISEVDAMRRICKMNGVDALVERSRSGRGAHIWIFFETPIPAIQARRFGSALLTKGADSVNLKDFKSYDRMIPMQDHLPDGGLGNLIALPLQGQALRKGNSAFIDEDWNVIPDQWAVLKNTRKLSQQTIEEKIQEWSAENGVLGILGGGVSEECSDKGDLPACKPWEKREIRFNKEDVAGIVQMTLSNGIYIDKSNLKARLQNQIRRLAAYNNPEFYKKQAMGFSTFDTPRIVYCGADIEDYIQLPRGCFEKLTEALSEADIPYTINDERQHGKTINVIFRGQLYPEQEIAVEKMLKFNTGVLSAATAFGKTAVGAYLIAAKKKNTLILVRNTEIMQNWQEDLNKFLLIKETLPTYTTPSGRIKQRKSAVGRLQASHNSLTGIIDVVMITSLGKRDNIDPIVKDYGLVLMDECHHAGADTDGDVLREVSAETVYGLTATPKREDGHEKKVFMQLGPIRHQYTAKERAEKQGIGHYIYPRFTRLVDSGGGKLSMAEINRLVVDSDTRNEQIINDTLQCVREGRTPIVMTKYREHAQHLYQSLSDKADHVFLLQGGKSDRDKDELRKKMRLVPPDETVIVVAIGKYIGEGFNYPRLDTLLLAMPIAWQGNVEQYAGRLNRDYEDKKDVIIFDYIDAHISTLERMYHKRLRAYRQIGFTVCANLNTQIDPENAIFDSKTYRETYEADLISANSEIVISSPGISRQKAKQFTSIMKNRQESGVKVVVLTLSPDVFTGDAVERVRGVLSLLKQSGIVVRCSSECSERFAVIDHELCWYGSMNLLSREKEDDNLIRIKSKPIAEELLLLGTAGMD